METVKYFKWIIFTLAVGIYLFNTQVTWTVKRDEPVFVEISKNESFREIIQHLKEKRLIRSKKALSLYARIVGLDTELKAGRYRIDPHLSPQDILEFLANPESGEISITIPEGFSVFEIDEKLTELGLITKNDFTKWTAQSALPLEGYLFPDTYFVFSKNFHPKDLTDAMAANFEKKVVQGLADELKKNKRVLAEIITMASLLEKEVRHEKDLGLVAGIIWKRLEQGWPLQVDASLLYGKKDRTLSVNELREDSPYNTYTRQGLPKTPIGNPGLKTIRAAMAPVESPFWFYLTDKDGNAIFGKTNEEHNENKRKYL